MTASPTAGATAAPPAWSRIGRIGDRGSSLLSVVGVSGGFVAAGDQDVVGATSWFSVDGRSWQAGALAGTTQDCSGNPTSDAFVSGAVSDGQRVLVLGKRLEFTAENCANPDLGFGAGVITWLTTDGRSWTRSPEFAHIHAIASHAWAIHGGGWELVTSSFDAPMAIWRSADGLSWDEVASFPEQVGSSSRGAADAAGTRLLEVQPNEDRLRLLASSDGVSWDPLPAQPAAAELSFVTDILPPVGSGPWIVVTADDESGSSVWTSADLGAWSGHDFPGARIVTDIVAISGGYLATAERVDLYLGECDGFGCPGPAERQYTSTDGVEWTQVRPSLGGGAFFAEAPAGVIAVGRYDGSVWLLER